MQSRLCIICYGYRLIEVSVCVGGKMKTSHRYSFRPFRLTRVFSLGLFLEGLDDAYLNIFVFQVYLILTVCININSCALQSYCNNITENDGNIFFTV
jgi:hypothetical protein